jgi:hypothetical protein
MPAALSQATRAGSLDGLHAIGDGTDGLDDPADVGGFAASRACSSVDTVLARRFSLVGGARGCDPPVGLATDEIQHAGSHGTEPDSDVVAPVRARARR